MHGKIMIIGGGTLQVPVLAEAEKLGLETIVIDRDPNCICAKLATHFETCDIFAPQFAATLAAQYGVDGVAAIAIDAEDTAGFVAEKMGLPGPPLRAAKITRNKTSFYGAMIENGLGDYVPNTMTINSSYISYPNFPLPWIVRPINQAGSRGTTIVWHKIALPGAVARAGIYSKFVQISELLSKGHEHSTEIMFIDGEPIYLNSVLRPFLPRIFLGGTAIEIGHISPSPLSFGEILFDLAKEVAKALNVNWGVLKIDTLIPYGTIHPYLLEATLRLSGGLDSTHTFPLAFGRSSVRAFLKLAMGETVDKNEVVGPRRQYAAAAGFWLPNGTVTDIATKGKIIQELGVKDVIFRASHGRWNPGPDCTNRAGFVVTIGGTAQQAWNKALESALAMPVYFRMGACT